MLRLPMLGEIFVTVYQKGAMGDQETDRVVKKYLQKKFREINIKLEGLEQAMGKLQDTTDRLISFAEGIRAEVEPLRARNAELERLNAEAIADDAQDTAQIESLIAENTAAADRIEQYLANAGVPMPETPAEGGVVPGGGEVDAEPGEEVVVETPETDTVINEPADQEHEEDAASAEDEEA